MRQSLADIQAAPPASAHHVGLRSDHLGVDYVAAWWSDILEHTHDDVEIAVPVAHAGVQVEWRNENGGERARLLHAGEVCIVAAGQPHTMVWEHHAEVLWFHLPPVSLVYAAHDLISGPVSAVRGNYGLDDPFIFHLGCALRRALAFGPPSRLYVESLGNALAVHLLTRDALTGEQARLLPHRATARLNLRRLAEYVQAHLADDLSLTALAAEMYLSPYHFARRFKVATGQTPHQYVTVQRLVRAKELLHTTDLPIADVAARVGFENQSHFTACFRRQFAVTPRAYRKATCRIGK